MRVPLKKYNKLLEDLELANDELNAIKGKLGDVKADLEDKNSQLKETIDKLEASDERFRQLAENTNDVIWLRNEHEFIYINNQFEYIFGRAKEEVIDEPERLSEWIHPEDRAKVRLWFGFSDNIIRQPLLDQYRIIKPDNDVRWLLTRSFLVNDESGNPYRIVSVTTDITEQKDFEKALQIAKRKAEESDFLKTTFLANISHEIRTPMNGIIGFAELLGQEDIDSETRRSYTEIMKKSSDQLICIINDLIDFAKIESNQIRLTETKVNLDKLMEQLLLFYEKELILERKTEVTIQFERQSEAIPEVLTDENRLRQVLSYLLDNSIKYTRHGFIKFGYKVSDSRVEFFAKDTGSGISKEKHEIIFERFRQVDEGHSRKHGGVGLGLSIASGLVNLLGGEIWLTSEPEKGSTFNFTIPYKTDQVSQTSGISGIKGSNIENKWKGKLVLIAEDDDLNFEYMKALLEPTEVQIYRAKDGNQAVKICSAIDFDLILMDIRLPVLNGIQATQQIRKMGKNTPVIAQTAFAMDDDKQKCLTAGCNRYITKPISKQKLFATMNELL